MAKFLKTSEHIPVKLIESTDNIVTLEVTESKSYFSKIYIKKLKKYAEFLQQLEDVEYSITDESIKIVFSDQSMAENVRQIWRKQQID